MICPKCGYTQYCDCSNCKDRLPEGCRPTIIDGEDCICANCGFRENNNWWTDYEWDVAVEGGIIERPLDYGVFVGWDGIEINYI